MFTHVSRRRILRRKRLHVSGRRILGRKCLHMSQEEGYWEGNVYICFRKMDINA
jgi:hypothetical protein